MSMTLSEIDNQIEHLMRKRDAMTRSAVPSICGGCKHASNQMKISVDSVCCDVRNVNYARRCHVVTNCKRVMR